MRSSQYFILAAVLTAGLVVGLADNSHAIPAFSREHKTECATCHTIFPELNEYGDVFLKNGFVWSKPKKDDAAGRKDAAVSEAAPTESAAAGKGVHEALWLAGLPQTVPLSVSATLNASYNDSAAVDKVDLSTRALSLLAGGVFRDKIGFFLKYNLYTEGAYDPALSNTPVNQEPPYANDLEEFYLVWRNSFGTPVNVKAGRFRPQLSLWQRSNRVGISDMATTSWRSGSLQFAADSPEDAVEANAVLFNRLFLAGGIVDRNGQDSNEGYGHVSVKFGGADFHAKEPDLDLDNVSILDYMYFVIGGYGYTGRSAGSAASTERDNFFRGGIEMDLVVMSARLKLAWANGRDSNPDFISHRQRTTNVVAAQGEYLLDTDLLAMFRYEHLDTDNGTRVSRYIPAVSYTPLQNTKVTLEYQHARADKGQNSNLALLGIRVAF